MFEERSSGDRYMSLARISLALCLGVGCAPGVTSRPCVGSPDDPGAARLAIQALEERIGTANFDCDYKFFAEVEAPEFIYTDARGSVTTRAEDLAGESNCRRQKGTYVLDEIRFQLHGAVAVYNARATTTVVRDGAASPARINRFTDGLVWRDCQWRLVSGHSSRIP
jgi:hypothetical protein